MFGSIQIGVDVVDLSLFRSGGAFGEVGGIWIDLKLPGRGFFYFGCC